MNQSRLFAAIPHPRVWSSSSPKFCTSSPGENHKNHSKSSSSNDEPKPNPSKTITEQFTESLKKFKSAKKPPPANKREVELLEPTGGYVSRFQYKGFLRRSHWKYYDDNDNQRSVAYGPDTEEQHNYRMLKKRKFCILLGFAGGSYHGMQYQFRKDINTIEKELFAAMVKNRWVLPEHEQKMWLVDFNHGSRTDTGVSAARMNVSMFLRKFIIFDLTSLGLVIYPFFFLLAAIDVDIQSLNKSLPPDIRVYGIKKATPSFNARFSCSTRTYSYTLPTIALSHYNDQSEMMDYRVPVDRLQRTNDVLSIFKGHTNFHNYTTKKLFFDRTSERYIHSIECGEPFVEHGVEFARITVKGSSFMLHQIRKMIGFTLAVVRGLSNDDWLKRSVTDDEVHTPTAPGLGLVLERLHFDEYAKQFKGHDPLRFDEFDDEVEQFRREKIHSFIVQTEIQEQSMFNWLQYLIYVFDNNYRKAENGSILDDSDRYDDTWGENEHFVEKLKQLSNE